MTPTVHRDERLELTAERDGDRLAVTLVDRASGRAWGPVPLLALRVHDKPLRRVRRAEAWRLDRLEEDRRGWTAAVSSPEHGIALDVAVRLEDGELSVVFRPGSLSERDPALYRLFAVDVLPGLVAARSGSLLLPFGSGLLVPTTHPHPVSDRFLVYGEQERWELAPTLPCCAAWDERGGLCALAARGACDAEGRIAVDGRGLGETGFAFSLRRTWIDPVDPGEREVRFVPLPAGEDPLARCADRVRRHVVDDLGKPTLEERAEASPEVAYLLDAYVMKPFHGVQMAGYMMEGKPRVSEGLFQNYMTFAEAAACFARLKEAGIDRVLTQCTGWNINGHDGLYPTRFPVEERLGGEAAFRAMIRDGQALGFHVQVHDNFIMQNLDSPDFERDYTAIDAHGEPLLHGRWAGGLEATGWPLAMPPERLGGHMRRMRELGLRGMYYVDYMEQPLEVNHHPEHGGPRADCARGQVLVVEEARRVFGACGTEFGFLPCAVAADHVSTCGDPWHLAMAEPDWPVKPLLDAGRRVPLWHMVFSGLTVHEARRGIRWDNAMHGVLLGGAPRDEWCVRPGLFAVLDDARIAALKAVYDLCVVRFGRLRRRRITAWRAEDAHREHTRFDDGTEVSADFETGELVVNGERVPRPEGLE